MNKGQSLFEVIFALGIAAIILVAMASLATTSIRNSTFSKDSAAATQLASQTTEWLRSERDTSWTLFVARSTSLGKTWCLSTLAWPGSSGACGPQVTGTIFTRSVTLTSKDADTNPGDDTVVADILVTWSDAQGTHDIKNQASYTDWRR